MGRELPDGAGTFPIGKFQQSKIEPELVLHICATPQPGMNVAQLLQCVDRIAPGFEIVFSPFTDWKVAPADATAAFGLHQAAMIGPWREIASNRADWGELMKSFEVTLNNVYLGGGNTAMDVARTADVDGWRCGSSHPHA